MSFLLSIETEVHKGFPDSELIKLHCSSLLEEQCLLDGLVNDFSWHLLLVDDQQMQSINHETRGIDSTTDVLSFPLLPFDVGLGTSNLQKTNPCRLQQSQADQNDLNQSKIEIREYFDWESLGMLRPRADESLELGDVILSVDQCMLQAKEIGHSVDLEFWRLCCHGLLHLFGYDHVNSIEDRNRMEKQEDLLFHRVTQT